VTLIRDRFGSLTRASLARFALLRVQIVLYPVHIPPGSSCSLRRENPSYDDNKLFSLSLSLSVSLSPFRRCLLPSHSRSFSPSRSGGRFSSPPSPSPSNSLPRSEMSRGKEGTEVLLAVRTLRRYVRSATLVPLVPRTFCLSPAFVLRSDIRSSGRRSCRDSRGSLTLPAGLRVGSCGLSVRRKVRTGVYSLGRWRERKRERERERCASRVFQ